MIKKCAHINTACLIQKQSHKRGRKINGLGLEDRGLSTDGELTA